MSGPTDKGAALELVAAIFVRAGDRLETERRPASNQDGAGMKKAS